MVPLERCWDDVQIFLEHLNEQEAEIRLLYEAQWEYAQPPLFISADQLACQLRNNIGQIQMLVPTG